MAGAGAARLDAPRALPCSLNNKMGGDLKKIQTVGRYMIEVWRAAGMNMENVEFIWASEAINGCGGKRCLVCSLSCGPR